MTKIIAGPEDTVPNHSQSHNSGAAEDPAEACSSRYGYVLLESCAGGP